MSVAKSGGDFAGVRVCSISWRATIRQDGSSGPRQGSGWLSSRQRQDHGTREMTTRNLRARNIAPELKCAARRLYSTTRWFSAGRDRSSSSRFWKTIRLFQRRRGSVFFNAAKASTMDAAIMDGETLRAALFMSPTRQEPNHRAPRHGDSPQLLLLTDVARGRRLSQKERSGLVAT